MDLEVLKADLRRDEDVKLKPYLCPAGKLTIGVGRNIEDRGISHDEADYLLENDIGVVMEDLDRALSWWRDLSYDRQRALANMCFNLGLPRLLKFKNMLAALKAGDFENAALEAIDSTWSRQVGPRADRIAKLFLEG